MCVVSSIGDSYGSPHGWPWKQINPWPSQPPAVPTDFAKIWHELVEGTELKKLEERVRVLEELLQKGKEYDAATGQPNCELDEKRDRIRKLAEELGVDIEFP